MNGQFSGPKAGKLIGQAEVSGNFNGIQGSAKGVFMNDKGYTPKEFRNVRK
ncbi:hypothetical protein [Thiomicrorhabdus sp. Milos-T2]|uniref:hypothetical protein n=1 Tax=Thiomicrorhabdus sp. Milos-T2 TaxID=90814 RepID=UPI000A584951|nr:hypothetical protein [Thiomicrorhabdus sp. Milos-T2]